MTEMLIYAGANLQARTRINDYTPLHLAAESGSGAVVKMLLTAGADVNATTTVSGVTPIHLAAATGNVDAVNALLEKGANPNAREAKWDQTPLIFAAANDRATVITALLARGADPNIASKGMPFPAQQRGFNVGGATPPAAGAAPAAGGRGGRGAAPAPAAAPAPNAPPANAPAAAAARGGRGGGGQGGQAAANVNDDTPVGAGSPGMGLMTPLHHAARQGNVEAVKALIAGGANLNATSFDSSTPLTTAVLNSQFDVAMELIKAGANVNKPLTYVNAGPLWLTINAQWQPRTRFPQPQEGGYQKHSYLDVMEALLDAGASPNEKLSGHPFFMEYTGCGNGRCGLEDMTNNTPFMRAAYSLDVPAMKLLVKRGANFTEGIVVAGNGARNGLPPAVAGAAAGANGQPPQDNVPRGTDGLPLPPVVNK